METKTLLWMQCGGCGGDTMAWLCSRAPDLAELLQRGGIRPLWHPSLSAGPASERTALLERITAGAEPLDILCLEGAIVRGPGGTGMYDLWDGRPKKDLVGALAQRARYVIAVGTCASFGGIGADGEIEACGAQYLKWERGGFLGPDFTAGSGQPVLNLPGCPCHPEVLTGVLMALARGREPELGELQTPVAWYGMLVHQGCTRNEYHEYRVEEHGFGEKGCLFFHMGCHGPLVYGPCNKLLWNGRSSKTRVGVPCFGCTRPDFPQAYPFFRTRNIEGVPRELPDGVDRAHYLAYKSMAAAAAPERLKRRHTEV